MTSQQKSPAVSILIVAYNSADHITACISAISSACTRYSYEVLLVDNGDGSTAALVSETFPEVRIVPGQGNIGFAAGNNLLARSATAPFLLLANPDLEMHAGAVDVLLDGAGRYSQAAAWGGVTVDRTGRPDIGNSVHVPSLSEMASRLVGRSTSRIESGDSLSGDRRAEALSGGFVMFSRRAWDEAGGMDERYFLYCEEVDLFYRLAAMGYEFWRIGAARAFHDIGHGQETSPMRELFLRAGVMEFARQHWSIADRFAAFVLVWMLSSLRFLAGFMLGPFSKKLKGLGRKHRYVALRPHHWGFGYHERRGLLARQMPRTR